jgi:hypothetical protein
MDQQESVASIIMHVGRGIVEIADGPPCEHAYRRVILDALPAGR